MSARMKKPALAVCAVLGLSLAAVAYLGAPGVGCATCNVHREDMEETMHQMEHALEKMTYSVEGMKALLQRSPRVAQLASAEPAVAEGLEDPQTLEELREFFQEELAVLRKMEQKWTDPAARERALHQIRGVLHKVEAVRADRDFQEWMAEMPEGRRLEAAAFPGMEEADGFQAAFLPSAARAPARSPLAEMAAKAAKKPVAKKPVAKKAAPKPAPKPAPKRAPPKRAPAPRPVARSSGGSGVTSQMGFGGYVKQSRVPSYSGQSFQAGDIGVLPPLGVWDPLGLINKRDMRRYEEMEIKQGRIAMLATIHVIVTEAGIRWPGYISNGALTGNEPRLFSDIPGGTLASWKALEPLGWFQLVFLFAVLDQQIYPQDPNLPPGDVGGDAWIRYDNDEQRTFKLNVERQNGRAAMLGITGMMIHEALGVDALYPTGGMGGDAPPAIFG